jgi:hypothetical protein
MAPTFTGQRLINVKAGTENGFISGARSILSRIRKQSTIPRKWIVATICGGLKKSTSDFTTKLHFRGR